MTEPVLRIFVCYRREETRWAARALAQSMDQGLSDIELFIDVDRRAIAVGENWRTRIETAIDASDVAIVLIGDRWFEIADSDGLRKLDNPDDPVRLELEQALKRDLVVIPVRLDEARMPRAADLPASISEVVFRQGMELRHSRWDDDVQSLLESVDGLRSGLLEKRAERERAKRWEQAERERPVAEGAVSAAADAAREQAESEAAARVPELERAARELVEQQQDAERERMGREQVERERLVRERAEQQRLAREAAERMASEQGEQGRRAPTTPDDLMALKLRSWLASVSTRAKILGSVAGVGAVIAAAWLFGVFVDSDTATPSALDTTTTTEQISIPRDGPTIGDTSELLGILRRVATEALPQDTPPYIDYRPVKSPKGSIKTQFPFDWKSITFRSWNVKGTGSPVGIVVVSAPDGTLFQRSLSTPGLDVRVSQRLARDITPEQAANRFNDPRLQVSCELATHGDVRTEETRGLYQIWRSCGRDRSLTLVTFTRNRRGFLTVLNARMLAERDIAAIANFYSYVTVRLPIETLSKERRTSEPDLVPVPDPLPQPPATVPDPLLDP
ncbi:MAG: TIR domain-containing protein [Actinobacteria bacterium]|nr:TIR domain-containing protein [Actinomycetota bacterium]